MADKYYTKPEAVKILLSTVRLESYDIIVEPSAGSGNISLEIAKQHYPVVAIDIEPEHPSIERLDFLVHLVKTNSFENLIKLQGEPNLPPSNSSSSTNSRKKGSI